MPCDCKAEGPWSCVAEKAGGWKNVGRGIKPCPCECHKGYGSFLPHVIVDDECRACRAIDQIADLFDAMPRKKAS